MHQHDPRARRFALRITIIVAALSMLAPFSIDTYLPSFPDISAELSASPLQMQHTLSFYLLAFGAMMLVHGPLSDAFGRRVVLLWALAIYTACSIGAALAGDIQTLIWMRIGQGLSAGAGMVVGRAIARDVFAGEDARRVMSNIMMMFALAPALAPIIGGILHDLAGWRAVFVFLVLFGFVVWVLVMFRLPETLPPVARQSIHPVQVSRSYLRALTHGRYMVVVLVVAINFGAFFLYIAASPVLLYEHLGFGVNDFAYLFVPVVGGMMLGSFTTGRLAGKLSPQGAVSVGFAVMLTAASLNFWQSLSLPAAPFNVIGPLVLYTVGLSFTMPSLTLLALDCFPQNRGMASALQGFIQMSFNGVVAGWVAAWLYHSITSLALGMLTLNASALLLWMGLLISERKSAQRMT